MERCRLLANDLTELEEYLQAPDTSEPRCLIPLCCCRTLPIKWYK